MKKSIIISCALIAFNSSAVAQNIEKTRHEERDGFVWYEVVSESDQVCGAYDKNGNILIPIEYSYIAYGGMKDYANGNFSCQIKKENSNFGNNNFEPSYWVIYNSKGKIVYRTENKYNHIGITYIIPIKKYRISIEKDGKWGIIDKDENVIIPPEYEDISPASKYPIEVKENGVWKKLSQQEMNRFLLPDNFLEKGYYSSRRSNSPSINNSINKPSPTKPGLLYSGHYTQSAQGRNVTTGQFTDPIGGDYQMEVEIYEDYITINSVDTYKFVKMVNGKRKYSGSPSFQMAGMSTYSDYYVDGNYNITMNTTMNTAFGSDTFVYTITKGESTMPVYNNPSGGGSYSCGSNGGSSRSSTTPNNRSTPRPNCAYCRGKGRVVHNSYQPMYGTQDYQVRCNECGGTFMKSSGHTHITCGHCGGTGKMK